MATSIVDFEIDWSDCDPAGIVFYPQYFRMMNTGVHKMFEHAGLSYAELTRRYTPIGTPLLDIQATFKSPARMGDKLKLETTPIEWRDKVFIVSHVMKAGERVVFEAKDVRGWVVVDPSVPKGIRAASIPREVRALFGVE